MTSKTFVNRVCSDFFSVVDKDTEVLIVSISPAEFNVFIFDSYGRDRIVAGDATAIDYLIEEIGVDSGVYKIEFTPDVAGAWVIWITHNVYFPWGKTANYNVVSSTYYCQSGGGVSATEVDDILAIILGTI